jgi:gamma-glutamyltranspeptidase/glutathione hydrolase
MLVMLACVVCAGCAGPLDDAPVEPANDEPGELTEEALLEQAIALVRQPPGWGRFEHGAVAADHEIASEAGAEMLRRGGNAVDAAVAASFALSVVRPYSCGIGGGGFMVIHLPNDPQHGTVTTALNYREMAPAAVGEEFYADGSHSSTRGATAVGVPGTVAGLMHAQEKYGTLDRMMVLGPAIRAAEEGFEVDADYVGVARGLIAQFDEHADWRERFGFVWTTYLRAGEIEIGDVIRNPAQGRALRRISADGADAFYRGPIADAVVATMARDSGVITTEDLREFKVAEVEPLRFRVGGVETDHGRTREFELVTMPPPSSGGIAIAETFGLLDRVLQGEFLSPTEAGIKAASRGAGDFVATLIEAFKHSFADRARWLGDPAFVDVPTAWILSDEQLDRHARLIGQRRILDPDAYGSVGPLPDDGGTSHLCAVDQWDGMVSCTETINLEFGSLLAVDEFGFALNNEMDDFTARPGEPNAFGLIQSAANSPEPGKRPLSSMSPTIVLDDEGKVYAAAGASGGPRIITSTFLVLSELMMELPESPGPSMPRGTMMMLIVPRIHHQWLPDVVYIERGPWDRMMMSVGDEVVSGHEWLGGELTALGYDVSYPESIGCVQFVVRGEDGWEAMCDPRKGGEPAGH